MIYAFYRPSDIAYAILELFAYNSLGLIAAYIPFYIALKNYWEQKTNYAKYIALGAVVLGTMAFVNDEVINLLKMAGARRE